MKRAAFILSLMLAISTPALAQSTETLVSKNNDVLLPKIAAQIGQHAVIRADFSQSKHIAAMKKPLVTAGRLIVSKQYGVLWQIEQPYRMSYVLGEERLIEIGTDGTRRERNVRDLPGMAQVGRVFRAMLGADTQALREYFDVKATGDTSKWEIELKPKQAQMAQFLEGLKIEGGAFINGIRIDESGGDKTQIQFKNTAGTAKLSDADMQTFTGKAAP